MIQNNQLFDNITIEEINLSNNLKKIIINEIRNSKNKILLSRYIELALYHPQYGYYVNSRLKFGKHGDFITAPLISDLFAAALVNQFNELLDNMLISKPCVLEFGAGNGQLMLDILKHDINDRIEYYQIIELSAELRSIQQKQLNDKLPHLAHKVKWLDRLPDTFDGIILGNEILDAIACESITWRANGEILQRYVTLNDNDNFVYYDEPLDKSSELFTVASKIIQSPSTDFTSEVNLLQRAFIKTLANILNTGYIILIDYGYSQNEYYMTRRNNGTLRGFYRQHLIDDILIYPGLIDITNSVDFTAVATTAMVNQLDFIGYTTQANFLINCGILNILEDRKTTNLSAATQVDLLAQFNYLISPNLMGETFKVIGFSKNIDFANWMGFQYNDKSYTL